MAKATIHPVQETQSPFQTWQQQHGSDFAEGVALLIEHKPDAVTKNILSRFQKLIATGIKPNKYEIGKLSDALLKISNPIAAPSASAPATEPPSSTPQEAAPSPVAEQQSGQPAAIPVPPLPQDSDQVLTSDLAKSFHKEHAHIHALMVSATTDADRARYAKDIIERIIPALDREYDRLRATASGTEPAAQEENEMNTSPGPILNSTDMANFKRLQSVRSRISRLKNELIPQADDAKRKAKLEKELAEKLAEKEKLEAALA